MLPGAQMLFDGGGRVNFVSAIESDGVACIVVPHVIENVNDTKVRIVCKPPNDVLSNLGAKNLFGYSLNDSRWALNNYNAGNPVEFQLYSASRVDNGGLLWQTYLPSGAYHEIVAARQNGNVSLSFDGSVVVSVPQSGTPVMGRYGLFTQNDAEGDAVNPIPGRTPTNMAVAAFDAWDGGVLATSLRPCLDKDGVACFYDLVSETYIYSVTGGSFTVSS